MNDLKCLCQAYLEGQKGLQAGGLPIGLVLAIDGEIVARGHNQRIQMGRVIRHAEWTAWKRLGD